MKKQEKNEKKRKRRKIQMEYYTVNNLSEEKRLLRKVRNEFDRYCEEEYEGEERERMLRYIFSLESTENGRMVGLTGFEEKGDTKENMRRFLKKEKEERNNEIKKYMYGYATYDEKIFKKEIRIMERTMTKEMIEEAKEWAEEE